MSGGPGTGMGIAVTTVTTDAQAPLGFIHTEPASLSQGLLAQGEKSWIYVKAGAALAAGEVCVRALTPNNGNYGDLVVGPTVNGVILSTIADSIERVVGVAQHAIADGEFGFIQRSGIGDVLDGGLTADLGIIPDNVGAATAAVAVLDPSFGLCIAVAVAPSLLGSCMLDCEG